MSRRRTILRIAITVAVLTGLLILTCCDNPSDGGSGYSTFITEVFDYRYGIGQHAADVDETTEIAEQKAAFVGESSDCVLLGGWGGYIVAGFDHDVMDSDGYDVAVFTQGGSGSEPAVVFVMADENTDDLPNDTWYELSGSETDADYSADTGDSADRYIRNYQVTYVKAASDTANITWSDNQGNSGELVPGTGSYSSGWWWNDGAGTSEVTYTGVKLPDVKYEDSGIWKDYTSRFTWGYAENYATAAPDPEHIVNDFVTDLPFASSYRSANRFDIADAVDSNGDPVVLESIRFIKVQSGVFQIAGWLNEVSTEISAAVDLNHPDYSDYRD